MCHLVWNCGQNGNASEPLDSKVRYFNQIENPADVTLIVRYNFTCVGPLFESDFQLLSNHKAFLSMFGLRILTEGKDSMLFFFYDPSNNFTFVCWL